MRKLLCLLAAVLLAVPTLSAQAVTEAAGAASALSGQYASAPADSSAFRVASFRKLDWDLDARSNYPVNDQNGHKAALIKVVTPESDFDFDVGVMGVVSVRQEIGEIWVYVPEKVRKITIRHKEFGIIRDYNLGIPLESAAVYELTLITPQPVVRNTVVVRDSIVYVQAPAEAAKKEWKPLGLSILATVSVPDPSAGAMALWCRKFGGYVRFQSNFNSPAYSYDCCSDGTTAAGYIWTGGESRVSKLSITAGGAVQCNSWLYVCAGAGYGRRLLLWQDSAGGWARVSDTSLSGLAADAGVLLRFGRFAVYAGISTTAFRCLDTSVGLGLNF